MPTAAALGVSFDQVTAAMSAMTNVGIDAATASTNLSQIFSALLKPTAQANEALKSVGLSAAGLRAELKEKGLLATLRTLQTAFEGNDTAIAAVFGNIRALRGVNALLSLDEAQLNGIFGDTAKALGNLQTAYDDTDGPQRRLDKAMAKLQVTAIQLGADVLPMVVDVLTQVANAASGLGTWWQSLDQDTKKLIISSLAWLAIAGPTLVIVGKLTSGVGALFKVVGFLAGPKGIPALVGPLRGMSLLELGPLGAAPAALLLLTTQLQDGFDTFSEAAGWLAGQGPPGTRSTWSCSRSRRSPRSWRSRSTKLCASSRAYLFTSGTSFDDWAGQIDAGRLAGCAALPSHAVRDNVGKVFADSAAKVREGGGQVAAAAADIPVNVAATLQDGAFVVAPAAEVMIDPAAAAIEKAKQDVADAANELIHTLATTLASNPKELQDAAKAMWDDILHPFPDAKQRIQIEGILANKTLIKGLTSPGLWRPRADRRIHQGPTRQLRAAGTWGAGRREADKSRVAEGHRRHARRAEDLYRLDRRGHHQPVRLRRRVAATGV